MRVLTTGLTRWGLLAAALAVGSVLVAARTSGGAIFSPGPLSASGDSARLGGVRSHAELESRCSACHAGLDAAPPMRDRCLHCHTDIQPELTDSSTLHGAMEGGRRCLSCHTEHRGRSGSLTLAADPAVHDRLGFSLAGHRTTTAGAAFTCRDCHRGGSFRQAEEGCAGCHREEEPRFVTAHVAAFGEQCLDCHDGVDRYGRNAFSHDTTGMPLTGGHRRIGCGECHAGARTPADFSRATADCASCHRKDDRHRGAFGADCAACHGTTSWEGARIRHSFPLDHGEGGRIACRTCHPDAPNYKTYSCYGCHEHSRDRVLRQHQEEGVPRDLDNCVRCHRSGREHEGGEGGD